jgi:hypothetical protein
MIVLKVKYEIGARRRSAHIAEILDTLHIPSSIFASPLGEGEFDRLSEWFLSCPIGTAESTTLRCSAKPEQNTETQVSATNSNACCLVLVRKYSDAAARTLICA